MERALEIPLKRKSPEAVSMGKRIADSRKATGLTQEQLARDVGVSSGAVGQWETGLNMPSLANLQVISRLINVSTGWLIEGIDPDKQNIAQEPSEIELLRDFRNLPAEQSHAVLAVVRGLAKR